MAAGWSVMDALNKSSKAAAEEKPKARFRTKDISIKKLYCNERNFYTMPDIEELAQQILAVGMMENLTVMHAPCEAGEYRIIAGERRWRALTLLSERGHEEFEIATCQIRTPAEGHEETVQQITPDVPAARLPLLAPPGPAACFLPLQKPGPQLLQFLAPLLCPPRPLLYPLLGQTLPLRILRGGKDRRAALQ